MKMMMMIFSAVIITSTCLSNDVKSEYVLANPREWARDAKEITMTKLNDGAFEIRHTGAQDWSFYGIKPIPAKFGDKFRLSCATRKVADSSADGKYSISAYLRDKNGKAVAWTYGNRNALAGGAAVTEFMVPENVATVEPRVTGNGPCEVVIESFKAETLGNCLSDVADLPDTLSDETDSLKVSVSRNGAGITIADKRTGRVWAPETSANQYVIGMWKSARALNVKFINALTMREWTVYVSPVPSKPEVLVTITGEGEMTKPLNYPQPFKTCKGDRLIVPKNEGISYPVDDPDGIPNYALPFYSGYDMSMSFYGVQNDASGAGYMGIIETADDAKVEFYKPNKSRTTTCIGPSWDDQKGKFGYARRVRFVFFEKGGYVAMCKRYREYAKEHGKLKTFAEKVKERPLVDRLLGAVNIWYWQKDRLEIVNQLKQAGIDRILWSGGGDDKQVSALANMDNVLVSRYDVYRDIYHPEQMKKLGWKSGGTNTNAWPEAVAWDSANSNDWRKAWPVKAKDGTWTYCACMCDMVSAKYCRMHVGGELKHRPYNTRFIDVTTCHPWDVCYNPAHPMTRTESREHRMDLLRLLGDEFGLVVGSETGHDAAVPYCDFFEGMLSITGYRVPQAGRDIQVIWTNPPPNVVKFQVGAEYRLPLWELVYHDCLCAHWYWGDYNNKLPSLWDKRDLFNVLYGTMGMFMFNRQQLAENKDRIVRSYNVTSAVARKTGYSEMTNHEILSADRMVQRSTFANGVEVTVNFGDKDFTLSGGNVIRGGAYLVSGL